MRVISWRVATLASAARSTVAFTPFRVGMPEVCVAVPKSMLAQAPYGMNATRLCGACLDMVALRITSPNFVLTRTFSPSNVPSSFMSSGSSSQTATDREYSSENLPSSRLRAWERLLPDTTVTSIADMGQRSCSRIAWSWVYYIRSVSIIRYFRAVEPRS
jgi:hypothetical protein